MTTFFHVLSIHYSLIIDALEYKLLQGSLNKPQTHASYCVYAGIDILVRPFSTVNYF